MRRIVDIDWQSVHWVVSESGISMKLAPSEKRMVIRRLADKMMKNTDSPYCTWKLSCYEVARRLQTTERTVIRYLQEMPPADKRICPECNEIMWVANGVIEPHPKSSLVECPMSGQQFRRGLAAIRPDLYAWAEQGVSA